MGKIAPCSADVFERHPTELTGESAADQGTLLCELDSGRAVSMKPHVICHMMSSIDGRIDPDALGQVANAAEYEATGDELQGDAWMCGRVTLQKDFADYAESEPFHAKTDQQAGAQATHVARKAESYAIAADTLGAIHWKSADIDGDAIVSLVSEQVPAEYLSMLRERGISYIVAGAETLDFHRALDVLRETFGVKTLLLEGGGHINGALLQEGLIDEVSLVLVPGIDGRHEVPTVFDGLKAEAGKIAPLRLKAVSRRDNDVLWLRYECVKS